MPQNWEEASRAAVLETDHHNETVPSLALGGRWP